MISTVFAPVKNRIRAAITPMVARVGVIFVLTIALFILLILVDSRLHDVSVQMHLTVLLTSSLLSGLLWYWLLLTRWFQTVAIKYRYVAMVLCWCAGMLVFAWRSPGWNDSARLYTHVYWPSLTVFIFPWLFSTTIDIIARVPPLRFKPVVFDSLKDVIAAILFTEDETKGIEWIFEPDFYELDESGVYQFKTFLPKNLKEYPLSYLFKSVISLHNITVNPQKPIHFLQQGEPFGWEFYDYPYWFWPSRRRYLNPSKLMYPSRFKFIKLTAAQRARSSAKLVPGFRAAVIYVTRSTRHTL